MSQPSYKPSKLHIPFRENANIFTMTYQALCDQTLPASTACLKPSPSTLGIRQGDLASLCLLFLQLKKPLSPALLLFFL